MGWRSLEKIEGRVEIDRGLRAMGAERTNELANLLQSVTLREDISYNGGN